MDADALYEPPNAHRFRKRRKHVTVMMSKDRNWRWVYHRRFVFLAYGRFCCRKYGKKQLENQNTRHYFRCTMCEAKRTVDLDWDGKTVREEVNVDHTSCSSVPLPEPTVSQWRKCGKRKLHSGKVRLYFRCNMVVDCPARKLVDIYRDSGNKREEVSFVETHNHNGWEDTLLPDDFRTIKDKVTGDVGVMNDDDCCDEWMNVTPLFSWDEK